VQVCCKISMYLVRLFALSSYELVLVLSFIKYGANTHSLNTARLCASHIFGDRHTAWITNDICRKSSVIEAQTEYCVLCTPSVIRTRCLYTASHTFCKRAHAPVASGWRSPCSVTRLHESLLRLPWRYHLNPVLVYSKLYKP